jgi:hypothetical protein
MPSFVVNCGNILRKNTHKKIKGLRTQMSNMS